jgi:RNA polymerase sigma factor (sigma-70 family)
MPKPDDRAGILIRPIRRLLAALNAQKSPDRQLLQRFVASGDEAAFAALVQRHAGVVLGMCRRILGHEHDAEDAFQATFLVLARKAGSIRKVESLASWLYGVAYRVSVKARASAARRRTCEKQAPGPAPADPADAVTWGELRTALDQELQRLPEKYRAPLVLCYLEGLTNHEAARQLGWLPGAVEWRVKRGRQILRSRPATVTPAAWTRRFPRTGGWRSSATSPAASTSGTPTSGAASCPCATGTAPGSPASLSPPTARCWPPARTTTG